MLHPLSSPSNNASDFWRQSQSRVLFSIVLMLAGSMASAAEPPKNEKIDGKESPAQFRAYLPTIRLKAMLDNERQTVADLEEWLRKYELWLQGGAVNLIQRGQIEEEYQRRRLRVLRLEADYRDSLDRFTSRFRISAERRRQWEDATISPMTKVFQQLEDLTRARDVAHIKSDELERAEDVGKVRPVLVKLLTESALVKNTSFPERFRKRWDEWKKIDDRKMLLERIKKIRDDLIQLRKRQTELLVEKQEELPKADHRRREDLKFERDLSEFQLCLLLYEKQEWKKIEDVAGRLKQQREEFFGLQRAFLSILERAYLEEYYRLLQSWPGLASVKIKDLDLLACKLDQAEETVASLLKTPDLQLAGKKKVRRIRILAEGYPIQQRIFALAFARRELGKEPQKPKPPPGPDILLPGLVGPVGPSPETVDPSLATEPLLKAESSFTQVKRQLLQTWIDYQMLRLDLYSGLGLPLPGR